MAHCTPHTQGHLFKTFNDHSFNFNHRLLCTFCVSPTACQWAEQFLWLLIKRSCDPTTFSPFWPKQPLFLFCFLKIVLNKEYYNGFIFWPKISNLDASGVCRISSKEVFTIYSRPCDDGTPALKNFFFFFLKKSQWPTSLKNSASKKKKKPGSTSRLFEPPPPPPPVRACLMQWVNFFLFCECRF